MQGRRCRAVDARASDAGPKTQDLPDGGWQTGTGKRGGPVRAVRCTGTMTRRLCRNPTGFVFVAGFVLG